jgi:hypothetical protein
MSRRLPAADEAGALAGGSRVEPQRAPVAAPEPECSERREAERAEEREERISLCEGAGAPREPERRDDLLGQEEPFTEARVARLLRSREGVSLGLRGRARGVGRSHDVQEQVRELAAQRDAEPERGEQRALTSRVLYPHREPSLDQVRPRRHHEQEPERQRNEQEHRGTAVEREAYRQSERRWKEDGDREPDERGEIVDGERPAQRDGEVHQPLQVDDLRALEIDESAQGPEKEKRQGHSEPRHHDGERPRAVKRQRADREASHEAGERTPRADEAPQSRGHGAEDAAAPELISRQTPP